MAIEWIPDYGELLKRGVTIPLEGTEDDAVAAVMQLLDAGGPLPSHTDVRQLVQDARAGYQGG
ncbi:hypothetical protein AA0Z99_13215 [Agrococcus sp. 1P02AA]|uniref:hypothetical protein n=1 Tax=Agrococcus sp. 1P02AA TaxID=3132259 RepID=UPI0039A6260D